MDACASQPCQHDGACALDSDTYRCTCAGGYSGDNCATEVNVCASSPCKNAGVCASPHSDTDARRYTCQCKNGFQGRQCEDDICLTDSPCGDHGTCVPALPRASTSVACTCDAGYSGPDCSADVCQSSPCRHGGTCSPSVSRFGFSCTCTSGFGGRTCEDDVCGAANDACGEHGTCQAAESGSGFECVCTAGWQGENCDEDIDECAPSYFLPTCAHKGECHNTEGSYTCKCSGRYLGLTCAMDKCSYGASAICLNGGSLPGCDAIAHPSGDVIHDPWKCACVNGWSGDQCEKCPVGESCGQPGGRGGGGRGGGH